MKLKNILALLLSGLMLVGTTTAVAAGGEVSTDKGVTPVYTANGYYTGSCYYPYYTGCSGYYVNGVYYPYYNGGYYFTDCDSNVKLDAYWNPVTGKYDTCTCPYCQGKADLSGYYWVNGVQICAKDYYIQYAPHTVIPSTVTGTTVPSEERATETTTTQKESSPLAGLVRKKKTDKTTSSSSSSSTGTTVITDGAKNPALVGSYNKYQTICGTYYAYDKVDLSTYFAKNTASLYLTIGEVQTFSTGFKMVSSNDTVVKIYNDANGQNLEAVGMGNADVYLYTAGGVPFMKLSVSVTNAIYGGKHTGYMDIQVGSWRLNKAGDSTTVVVKVAEDRKDNPVKLTVVQGNGYIQDGKLVATGNGPIVLKAYDTKASVIQGYAIVYVGEYVDALYDGYWTTNGGNISCNYWNPNLWSGNYKINGWVLTDTGCYLPVISKVETTTEKPNGDKVTTTTTIYSDVYDLLYGSCYGNVDSLYGLLIKNGKLTGSYSALYQAALQEILDDIADGLVKQYK